jgi:hypothetical protein
MTVIVDFPRNIIHAILKQVHARFPDLVPEYRYQSSTHNSLNAELNRVLTTLKAPVLGYNSVRFDLNLIY